MADEYRFFQVEKDGQVIIWMFNNPPQNLWTMETAAEFGDVVEALYANPELRVGILTSARPDVFIQHFDVSLLVEWGEALKAGQVSMPEERPEPRGVYRCGPKPVIAAINAPVAGGGLELCMACDFRFMSRAASVAQPEVGAGILAGGGGTQRMPRLIGLGRALELQLTGRRVFADEAERIGLVTRSCDPLRLMPETLEFAQLLASQPPLAVELIRRCIYEGTEMPLQDGLAMESAMFRETIMSGDALDRMRAYVDAGQDVNRIREILEEAEQ
ncbi:MAG TPA: enoyl-CoA hydratase/isomerase family protein [Dehalococcoidia bacterium]|nr:enoyl-CoA hydratase/isomerase family protein [Dehalococcoidia bacterium]